MKRCCVVAAGPSLKETLPDLRALSDLGVDVICVNHAHDWLVKQGITPKFCILPESFHHTMIARTVSGCTYVIRQDARPETKLTIKDATHVRIYSRAVNEKITCRGLPVVNVAHWLGYREFDLFGFDGSFPEKGNTHMDGSHPWATSKADEGASIRWCVVGDRVFKSHKRWRHQTRAMIELLKKQKVEVRIHGDGMLAAVAKSIDDFKEFKKEKDAKTYLKGMKDE